MPLRYSERPELALELGTEFASDDLTAFGESLDAVPDETPLGWLDNREYGGRPGIWLLRGTYRRKHQTVIDPTDLACYGATVYVADPTRGQMCLQIGHGLEAPEGATVLRTAGELKDALAAHAVEEAAEVAEGAQPYRLIEPDGAFEFHRALTKGWHAGLYAEPASATPPPEEAGDDAPPPPPPFSVLLFD